MKISTFQLVSLVGATVLMVPMVRAADRICKLSSGFEISAQINSCLDAAQSGDRLLFAPGIYYVSKTIEIRKPLGFATLDRKEACGTEETHPCAEFRANSDLFPQPGEGVISVKAENVSMENIVVNGAKKVRRASAAGELCSKGDNAHGYNFSVFANHFTAIGLTTKNALCATGFLASLGVKNLTLKNSFIADNGVHNQEGMWADGATIHDLSDSEISHNTFSNNTDIDLVFGGCQNCRIEYNRILHDSSFEGSAFAGLMMHAWPNSTSGNFTGTVTQNNQVDCGKKRCGFGIYLGAEAWYSAPFFGGRVENNQIKGAMLGLNVDRSTGSFVLANNLVSDSGGRFLTSCGMRTMGAYNISVDSIVDRGRDQTPSSSYTHESWKGCIPNWWTRDSS